MNPVACLPLRASAATPPFPSRCRAAPLPPRSVSRLPPRASASTAGSSGVPCQRMTMTQQQQLHTSFTGVSLHRRWQQRKPSSARPSSSVVAMAMASRPAIQFIQGTDEQTVPDVRLTKSRDGTNGVAVFTFDQPSVFDSSAELGDITGFYMIDEEGTLTSVDVSAKFVNGKPAAVEAKYVMRTPRDWDRFMRFMERYSQANGLQFLKK